MMLHVPKVLTSEQVAECRRLLDTAEWSDGKATVGEQGALVKRNRQLPELSPDRRKLRQLAVAFDQRALLAHGGLAVRPLGGVEQAAAFRHLLEAQDFRHVQHHGADARTSWPRGTDVRT